MKKKLSIIAVILMFVMMFSLVGCNDKKPTADDTPVDFAGVNSDGAEVKMSVLYEKADTRMRFISGSYAPYASTVDGQMYRTNDFKPAWKAIQEKMNFKIEDVTPEQGTSVASAYSLLQANKFENVNILSGSVTDIVRDATGQGKSFVNLAPYIERGDMPYLKKFLEQNELVEKTVTSANDAIYYAPYFDGYDDIETMFILRKDWVEKLLDADDTPESKVAYDTDVTHQTFYQSYYDEMDTSFTAMKDEDETQTVSLKYGAGQGIIDLQNKLATKNGKTLTEELKAYIDKYYVTPGYIQKRSDLFCGQNACYNADELIALMRCVRTNPKYLANKSSLYVFYPRDWNVNRLTAILQLAQLWGVRGYDSRNSYFYIDKQGYLADGRTSQDMMEALGLIHQLYLEDLIVNNYDKGIGDNVDYRESMNKENMGFMTYDYNQTTTIYNEICEDTVEGMNLTPILFPVADWDNKATFNGTSQLAIVDKTFPGYKVQGENVLYQYTESWRSIKSEAWAITSNTRNNLPKFKKCIELFDYMYSPEGQILMSYGPDAFLKTKDASINLNSLVGNINDSDYEAKLDALTQQKYETIDYYTRKVPAISDKCLAELKNPEVGGGNYTNYYRYYVGATLPIGYEKEQGMEYQTVDEKGKVGLDYIVNAVKKGVLRHAQVNKGADGNLSNSLVPTTFPLTDAQNGIIVNKCTKLGENFNNTSANGYNEFHNYIKNGFDTKTGGFTMLTPSDFIKQINEEWGGTEFYTEYDKAYNRMYGPKQ